HVHLEEVPQVVKRRAREPEMALLLYGRGLGVPLRDDDAPQVCTVLTRHFLPGGLAPVRPEADAPVGLRRIEEDTPAIVGHFHIAELRPPRLVDAHRRAQVNIVYHRAFGPDLAPP